MILFLFCLFYQSLSQCTLPGFDFSQIAADNSWSAQWTPPWGAGVETITYAPCTNGTSTGCGTEPPFNQCYQPNCCAVCQTWIEDTGPAGACLGKASNFQSLTEINSTTVKLTYGGGDLVETSPRQIDIYFTCDPESFDVLKFVNFIPAISQNPPPPVYLYQLYLSSSALCGTAIF
jgi:hypothetical protein